MKKTIALILITALTAALTACAGGDTQPLQSAGAESESSSASPAPEVSLDGEIGGEITVQSYDAMMYKSLLEEAAKLFEEKYPGTKVNVETFSAMPEMKTMETDEGTAITMAQDNDPQSQQDYLSKINTQLMSGKGADILAMDVLPVHRYAKGGQLEDLGGYMEADADFNRGDYRGNIFDAVRLGGGTYFLPLNYSFDYYAYDSTLYSEEQAKALTGKGAYTFGELIELSKPAFDEKNSGAAEPTRMFSAYSNAEIIERLLTETYGEFVDEEAGTANFNDGKFASLLESVKGYSDAGYLEVADLSAEPEDLMAQFEESSDERFFFKPKGDFSLLQHFNKDSGLSFSMSGYGGGTEEDDEIAGSCADSSGNVPFKYDQAFGINANSPNKRTAWEFIKFLLSEDMQLSSNLMLGFPVNNNARERKAELMMSGEFFGAESTEMTEAQKVSLAAYKEAVESLSDKINTYNGTDASIMAMIHAELEYYTDGSKSAEEVAAALQSKVDLYLNE